MKSFRFAGAIAAIAGLVLAGVVPAEAGPRLSQEELATLLDVKDDAEPGVPLTLDLSKDSHWLFLKQRLGDLLPPTSAGKNVYGADLAQVLAKTRVEHRTAAPSQELTLLQKEVPEGTWHPGAFVAQMNPTGDGGYFASAVVAVPDSMRSILILQLFDQGTWQPIGPPAVADEWLKNAVWVSASGRGPTAKGSFGPVVSVFTYLYLSGGTQPVAQVIFEPAPCPTQGTGSFSALDPCPRLGNDVTNCSRGQVMGAGSKRTKICLDRAAEINSDCDLMTSCATKDTPRLRVFGIVSGMADSLAESWAPTNVKARFVDTQNNTCESTIEFASINSSSFKWHTTVGSPGTSACLTSDSKELDFTLAFEIQVTNKKGAASVCRRYTVNSSDSCSPATAAACINRLTVAYGCLPAGTLVRMADGESKKIEDVEVGQEVRADERDRRIVVVDTIRGTEKKPLVAIADDRGNRLVLTETHPVVTGRGVVQAKALQPGDDLRTEAGASKVVSVDRIPSATAVEVYNLNLERPQGEDGPDRTTLFAGGILVGDNQMQGIYEERARTRSGEEIPPELRGDYESWAAQRNRP